MGRIMALGWGGVAVVYESISKGGCGRVIVAGTLWLWRKEGVEKRRGEGYIASMALLVRVACYYSPCGVMFVG
jgi:hypothetical protein